MAAPTVTPKPADDTQEHNKELAKLNKNFKSLEAARAQFQRALKQLNDVVEAKCQGANGEARKLSKTLPGTKTSVAKVDAAVKLVQQVTTQVEQLRSNVERAKV